MGFIYAMEGLDSGRLGIGAQGSDRAQGARAVAQVLRRAQAVRRAIEDFQAVQFKLADMATRIRSRAGAGASGRVRKDAGEDVTLYASMAKLFASETAMWVTTQAIQLFGGYGYMRDFPSRNSSGCKGHRRSIRYSEIQRVSSPAPSRTSAKKEEATGLFALLEEHEHEQVSSCTSRPPAIAASSRSTTRRSPERSAARRFWNYATIATR